MTWDYDAITTRDAFGEGLLTLARENDRVFAVGADTTKSMGFSAMEREFPDRVFNVGICEQNMAMIAAGLAACGGTAFAATYAPFAAMRMLEQVRTFAAYTDLDVKIVSGLGGLSGNIEGVTHQGLEDVSIMRAIPNLVVVVPADAASCEVITTVVGRRYGPAYIRVGRGPVPKVFGKDYRFEVGRANTLRPDGDDAAVIV
ncbi:MAG: transketolase family protein, partial [Planctomycetes bacterium]|nr:transketolase family protein [Planctomycetota bacterium]